MIDGEPYLCLPQLLHHIQREFPLDKVIEIFEQTTTNFPSATLKQVEGFIKSSVLPPNASSCPLICRSAADRVCLRLFDQISHNRKNQDGICSLIESRMVSGEARTGLKLKAGQLRSAQEQTLSLAAQTKKSNASSNIESSPSNTPILNKDSTSQDSGCDASGNSQVIENTNNCDPTATANSQQQSRACSDHSNSRVGIELPQTATTSTEATNNESKSQLFEVEAHSTILDFVRAATSTLMIQIYHKCFGKCNGVYYPSLLKDSDSKCIECATCDVLLSPRRFIGHMHGNSRELNVCHWGFNSYNWRHYLKLSKCQSMNNLDEDELLSKFNQLKSIPDIEHECPMIDIKFEHTCAEASHGANQTNESRSSAASSLLQSTQYDNDTSEERPSHHPSSLVYPKNYEGNQESRSRLSTRFISESSEGSCELPMRSNSSRGEPSDRSNQHMLKSESSAERVIQTYPPTSSMYPSSEVIGCKSPLDPYDQQHLNPRRFPPDTNPIASPPADPIRLQPEIHPQTTFRSSHLNNLTRRTNREQCLSKPTHCFSTNYFGVPDEAMSSYGDSSRRLENEQFNLSQSQFNNIGLSKNLQRDTYISTRLATFLHSRQIGADLARDIVACTLRILDESRELYFE